VAYVRTVFDHNFLEYASYVIRDRAIPHLDDGLKPVQRRILHSLFEMDDGKLHKVANVVGHCMRYHPHGDASIYSALVVLANKELLIDKQGNFGNILTGDEASAARYIECRAHPMAKDILYNPELTTFEESYDGRNKEPVTFPAKVPLLLLHGAEGIAVGMSTKVLPHNFIEVVRAVQAQIENKPFVLYPDSQTGGFLDAGDYEDGNGRVRVRALLDTSDPKRIVIRELPLGTTTETLIASIDAAAKRGKVKVAAINDFTTEKVEIELALPRGIYAKDVEESLYAFTDCEASISCNLLVIQDNRPRQMTVTEVIQYHAKRLVDILRGELSLKRDHLKEQIHARTLERIFIEERIYKRIEEERTQEGIFKTVREGFKPFLKEIPDPITDEDIERLLRIPIRRISRYDIERAQDELRKLGEELAEIEKTLKNVPKYAVGYLDGVLERYGAGRERRAKLISFEKTDVRDAATRGLKLRYDGEYLGYGIETGDELFAVSEYDRIVVIKEDGVFYASDVPEKEYVGNILACVLADKEKLSGVHFSLVYRNAEGDTYLKRFTIEGFILKKSYDLVPSGGKVLSFSTRKKGTVRLDYVKKPRMRVTTEEFPLEDYRVSNYRAKGYKLSGKAVRRANIKA